MALKTLGRYEILDELGKGAMGLVYLARDPLIGRQLAIKTFNVPLSAGDQELEQFRARFLREAQSAGILSHPNIVTIHDVMVTEDGTVFIAMEFIKGTDLKILMQRSTLDSRFVAEVVAQIADGLDYAHGKGVVHRDIKPANILLTADKQAKITDFGIAHLDASNLTAEGQMLGTPNYMSPEMIRGGTVDHRADIFSLGVMLYEMLTRKKPFFGENLTAVSHKIVYEPFPPPDQIVPGLPQNLIHVLDRALAKEPEQRYGRASEMAADLRAAHDEPVARSPVTTSGSFLTTDAPPASPPSGAFPVLDDGTLNVTQPGNVAQPGAGPLDDGTLNVTQGTVVTAPAGPFAEAASAGAAAAPVAPAAPAPSVAPAGPVAAAPSTKSPLLWIAGAVVALAVVAGGAFVFFSGGASDRAPDTVQAGVEGATGFENGSPPPGRSAGAAASDEGSGHSTPEGQVEQGLADGRQALADGDYARAVRAAESVLALEPKHPEATELLAEAQQGQERRAQVRDRLEAGGTAAASRTPASRDVPPPPPRPAPAAKATLNIDFRSEVGEGRVTVYAGQDRVFQESFKFSKGSSGVFRRSNAPASGRLSAQEQVASGNVTLRVYVKVKDVSQTRTAEVKTTLAAGGSGTLRITLSPEGRLKAEMV